MLPQFVALPLTIKQDSSGIMDRWLLNSSGWDQLSRYLSAEGGEPTEEDFKVSWFWETREKEVLVHRRMDNLLKEWVGQVNSGKTHDSFFLYCRQRGVRI